MSTLEISLIIAVAAQIPLLAVAFLVEFSQRKKRPSRPDALPAVYPQVERWPVESVRGEPAPLEPVQPQTASRETAITETSAPAPESPTLEPESPPTELPPVESALPPVAVSEPSPSTATQIEPPPEISVALPPEIAQDSAAPVTTPIEAQPAPIAPERVPPPLAISGAESPREPVRIGLGLRKTRENFIARIRAAITGSGKADEIYEGLEEALIGADTGVETSLKIVEAVRSKLNNDARPEVIRNALKEEIERILLSAERPLADSGDSPLVIMMAGVNGAGKTTTVAKLAALFKHERGLVIVAASDTFRAAAIEQLQVWCDRVGVDLIKQKQGSDPAAVAFDAVKAAVARKASAVLIDTAGRLQTKVNLMEELKKVARVVARELPGAPHETWLVLDANTGQNALSQAKQFGDTVPLTGVILAKLDSTAKGGVIIGIAERLKLPVRFVGLGENLEDLRPFDAHEFAEALFADGESGSAKSYAA
ncbi:MAG TPA: signal recognition particle-docking protein FtsY [Candidatus Binataceae bacterium]|nr:signal recognition particle-docking protein FtsY [Candidatus Binataceae bacterium]